MKKVYPKCNWEWAKACAGTGRYAPLSYYRTPFFFSHASERAHAIFASAAS